MDTLLDIVKLSLEAKNKGYEIFKNESIETILRNGETRWLCRKATLEAEIDMLQKILNLPERYDKEADLILNPKSSSTPRRKKGAEGGENG